MGPMAFLVLPEPEIVTFAFAGLTKICQTSPWAVAGCRGFS